MWYPGLYRFLIFAVFLTFTNSLSKHGDVSLMHTKHMFDIFFSGDGGRGLPIYNSNNKNFSPEDFQFTILTGDCGT